MESITFLVQGSAIEPYKVTFRKNAENLTALCDCPAGIYGQYFKHRFNILAGSTKGIVSWIYKREHVISGMPSDVTSIQTGTISFDDPTIIGTL